LTDAHAVLATVVEMVHMATLVHDDVSTRPSSAEKRNHQSSAATKPPFFWATIDLPQLPPLLQPRLPICLRIIGRTTNQVCEGELL
jgi:hypothetical protein